MLQLMDAINDGFGSFVSLVIFVELIRRLDANRRRFLFALCLVGIVVSEVAQAGLRYRMAELTGEMIVTMEDKPPMVMRPMDRLRPERRERYTSFVARSVFQDSGKLMSVMDAAGNSRLFAPSQRELRLREDYLVAVGDLKWSRDSLWSLLLRDAGMLVGAMVCAAVLVAEARRKRKQTE